MLGVIICYLIMTIKLLNKTNPTATRRSIIIHAILGAVGGPAFLFLLGKPWVRAHWPVLLPVFSVLGAGIAGIAAWQVDDSAEKPDHDEWRDAFDV